MCVKHVAMSFVKIKNNRGPRLESWNTPESILELFVTNVLAVGIDRDFLANST